VIVGSRYGTDTHPLWTLNLAADPRAKAGLIAREPDADDRRASRVMLTTAGRRKLTAAIRTYEAEAKCIPAAVLRPAEQRQMHEYIARPLTSSDHGHRS
jgi:hypothetical protein